MEKGKPQTLLCGFLLMIGARRSSIRKNAQSFPCGFRLHLLLIRIANLSAQYGQRPHRTVPRPLSVLLEQYNKNKSTLQRKINLFMRLKKLLPW